MDWMRERDILKHWVSPENNLNFSTFYALRPVGNSLEMMPLHCSILQHIVLGVRIHII